MRAIQCARFGGPEVLDLVHVSDPVAVDGQLLVDVSAAGVNFADTSRIAGSYRPTPQLPFIPGTEVVGRTADGLRVLAPIFGGGGFAERAAVEATDAVAVPDRSRSWLGGPDQTAQPRPAHYGRCSMRFRCPPWSRKARPRSLRPYLELLYQVLEDGVLIQAEADSLTEVAKAYSLSYDQVQATHRAFLLALAHRIVEDGKVTRHERAVLLGAAAALGFSDDLPSRVLDEANAALGAHRTMDRRPLPAGWAHGAPLHIDQGVAFTGCDPVERARLEGRAQAAGLRVTGSVSRKTAVLVTDGANLSTTKAVAARRHGTRVVSPRLFAQLLDYIQPAGSLVDPNEWLDQPQAAPDDPATIRAWARASGLPVGVRGRIPGEVLTAYRARNGAAAGPVGQAVA